METISRNLALFSPIQVSCKIIVWHFTEVAQFTDLVQISPLFLGLVCVCVCVCVWYGRYLCLVCEFSPIQYYRHESSSSHDTQQFSHPAPF